MVLKEKEKLAIERDQKSIYQKKDTKLEDQFVDMDKG